MVANPKFSFISGDDEFLVNEKAQVWFENKSKGITEELSKEVIDGRANNIDEVRQIVERFSEGVQTPSLFGGPKVVWLKAVNFLANSQTGNAKVTLELLESLKLVLGEIEKDFVSVLISASPVYKVRNFYKWCAEHSEFVIVDGSKIRLEQVKERIQKSCLDSDVKIDLPAIQMLFDKVQGNSRLISMEIDKLITYIGKSGTIDEGLVNEMVPNFGEGDFFEATDAFFSADLTWALDAISRHFFTQSEGRPLLGSLQSRNRLMIQLRILKDSGELESGYQGIQKNKLAYLSKKYAHHFDADSVKSNLNIFTQNPYYLSRLVKDLSHFPLKRLIDFQIAFAETFGAIIRSPKLQEESFKQLVMRCLGTK